MSPRAFLLACAAIGFTASEAEALTPFAFEASIDPSITDGPSQYATIAPHEFERRPDVEYEPTAYVADARANLQCVPFAREESGVEIYGNANTWWQQAKDRFVRVDTPEEQAVMVLRGYATDNRGHVAVVREVVSERMIIVDHANWLNGGEVTRNVPVRDVSPNNDWSQVQVWHVPLQQWGVRTYRVRGFILNMVQAVRDEPSGAAAAHTSAE